MNHPSSLASSNVLPHRVLSARGLFLFLVFLLASSFGCVTGYAPQPVAEISVQAIPAVLDERKPERTLFGALTFLAGFELRSDHHRFTELSGLVIGADGTTLYAVSDQGYWLSARLSHDQSGRLVGFASWQVGDLLSPEGRALRGRFRDAEALAQRSDGSMIVAFERLHRIWRYPPAPKGFTAPARVVPIPPGLAKAPSNEGVEALTELPDGRLLALTGGYKNPDGSIKGWILAKDRFDPVSYVPADGLQPTDMAALSNGDVILLEHYFNRLTRDEAVRLRLFKKEEIFPGASLQGEVLAELRPPLAIDNFEGLAVREDPHAGTLLYMVSDDNRNPLQRTLLYQFRLERGPMRPSP